MTDKLQTAIDIPISSSSPTVVEPPVILGRAAVYISPAAVPIKSLRRSVFLAGSIEQVMAEKWQSRITDGLSDLACTIFNPRRLHWDSSWEQRASNSKFREQVEWELNLMKKADIIAMYFDPATKSPITLLELGLHAAELLVHNGQKKLIVCCPDGYHRLGNVEIVCERAGIPVLGSLGELVEEVRQRLQKTEDLDKQA